MDHAPTLDKEALLDAASRNLFVHCFPPDLVPVPELGLTILTHGEGVYVWDVNGHKLFDAYSGLSVVGIGHGRREIAEAASKQISELAFVNPTACVSPVTVRLTEKLAELAPGDLNRAFFVSSGSEAIEMALAIAKQYHYNRGDKDRKKVVCRIGSYHGQTAGAESVTRAAIRPPREPMVPGTIAVPSVSCWRCPYEKTYPECDVFCARVIEDFLHAEQPETVAAIIAEPISASNGGHVPPAEYWQTLRRLCDRFGILLIADEVLTGFGRTGRWFAVEHFDVVPDIVAVAKHLTSGYAPMGAALVGDRVFETFRGDLDKLMAVGSTFGGNPVSSAIALANLEVMEREGLVQNAAEMGAYLKAKLLELEPRLDIVGDVRGIGLMCALQLVRDKKRKAPFSFDEARMVGARLSMLFRQHGVLIPQTFGVIGLHPPLSVTRSEIDDLVARVGAALGAFTP